jgi:hypothetical protein
MEATHLSKLFALPLTALVVALAVPTIASATTTLEGCHSIPNLSICLVDGDETSGGCPPRGTDSVTGVFVQMPEGYVYAEGSDRDRCGYQYSGIYFGAAVLPVYGPYASAAWSSSSNGCQMGVYAITHHLLLGCPAGPPPNPGWGHLLP